MKKTIWYIIISSAIALFASCAMGWPFWKIFIALSLAYGILLLQSRHPRIAKTLAVLMVIMIVGSWSWSWFARNFPLVFHALPNNSLGQQAKLATAMDPGWSKTRATLLLEIQKKDVALEKEISQLMVANNLAGVSNAVQRSVEFKKSVNKLVDLMDKAEVPLVTPPPRNLGWIRWEVKPTTNTVIRVYNDDEFIYKSPMPFKVSEVGGTEHLHNPSVTPGEIRAFRFYDLPTEGREIKILPVDGTNAFWLDFRIDVRRT